MDGVTAVDRQRLPVSDSTDTDVRSAELPEDPHLRTFASVAQLLPPLGRRDDQCVCRQVLAHVGDRNFRGLLQWDPDGQPAVDLGDAGNR